MKLYTAKGVEIESKPDESKLLEFQMDQVINRITRDMAEKMYGPSIWDALSDPIIITDKYGDEVERSKGEPIKMTGIGAWLDEKEAISNITDSDEK